MTSSSRVNLAFDLDFSERKIPNTGSEIISIAGREVAVTPVFDAYWRFAAERQEIYFKRLRRNNSKLTLDPILGQFKFTNAYRASDRVSQYLIRNVIYRDDLPSDPINLFFRVLLFKIFNKIETWQLLEGSLGPLTWERFNFNTFNSILSDRMLAGGRIYSAAYIMPSPGKAFGHKLKHENHLRLIEFLIAEGFPNRLRKCADMAKAYALMISAPSIGPFLAYQYVTDLNYSELTNFDEDDFVVAGPGALDGISKCFVNAEEISSADIIQYMRDNQARYFSALGIEFKSLWGRPLQLIDCQNVFCEISKYARVAFPEFSGVSGRTRIKQKYSLGGHLPAPWYPPKWGINDQIEKELFS